MPAMAPMPALTPKEGDIMRFLGIPDRSAPNGSVEVASMAFPREVRCERK